MTILYFIIKIKFILFLPPQFSEKRMGGGENLKN